MSENQYKPTEADILASLIKRSGRARMIGASVQRSHRFPLDIICKIENMALMADTSVSLIINQLLEAGIEAVKEKLTKEEFSEINTVYPHQINRSLKQYNLDSESKPRTAKK